MVIAILGMFNTLTISLLERTKEFGLMISLGARARGACILRTTPKIKWDKDRGKEPQRPREDYPWFWGWDPDDPNVAVDFVGGREFDGNRWNDLHYTRAFKQAARDRHAAETGGKS